MTPRAFLKIQISDEFEFIFNKGTRTDISIEKI
jgi:hypothetical protein